MTKRKTAIVTGASRGIGHATALQERLQARRLPVPSYVVVDVAGEAHAQTFHVECRIPAFDIAVAGDGPSRRAAEQAAAAAALAALDAGAVA